MSAALWAVLLVVPGAARARGVRAGDPTPAPKAATEAQPRIIHVAFFDSPG
jgi:hypothetical protein